MLASTAKMFHHPAAQSHVPVHLHIGNHLTITFHFQLMFTILEKCRQCQTLPSSNLCTHTLKPRLLPSEAAVYAILTSVCLFVHPVYPFPMTVVEHISTGYISVGPTRILVCLKLLESHPFHWCGI